jgi:PGF-CTERM protein
MALGNSRDHLTVALAVLVVGSALVGAVTTTTAQPTDQPRLTSDRHVVQGQTVTFDVSAVPNTEESVTLYSVNESGVEQPIRPLRVENGSVEFPVEGLDPGRYALVVGDERVLRLDDGVAESAGDVTNQSAVERADFRVVTAENASASLADDPITLDGQTARISADTMLLPGTELTVRARSTADAQNPFVQSMAPTVASDGSVTATFDTPANASTEVRVTLLYEDATLAEQTAPLGQQSTPTPSPTTATTGDTTTQPTDTQTTVPGFGVVVALLAVLGAGLLASRR